MVARHLGWRCAALTCLTHRDRAAAAASYAARGTAACSRCAARWRLVACPVNEQSASSSRAASEQPVGAPVAWLFKPSTATMPCQPASSHHASTAQARACLAGTACHSLLARWPPAARSLLSLAILPLLTGSEAEALAYLPFLQKFMRPVPKHDDAGKDADSNAESDTESDVTSDFRPATLKLSNKIDGALVAECSSVVSSHP